MPEPHTLFLHGANVLTPAGFRPDVGVLVESGRIAAVTEDDRVAKDAARVDLGGGLLLPGFIDAQVNGGGGVLFNDAPTVESIAAIASAHRRFGTTSLLPTLITDDLDVVRRALAAVDAAIEAGVPGVLGIHLEGPFLNAAKRGIHDASLMRVMDEDALHLVTSLKRGVTLITLAPELAAPGVIRRLTEHGVVVAAGHTAATYQQVREAFNEGLRGFTHLFNAMTPLTSREPGVVGAALESTESWCGVIVDGQHVHPASLKIALRAKSPDRFFLVTDAMATAGSALTEFMLNGQRIVVKNGACVAPDGTLAGSNLDMATAVRNVHHLLGLPLETAVRMASASPARFLKIDAATGTIAPGLRADLVHVNADLVVQRTWIGGSDSGSQMQTETVAAGVL